MYTEIDIFVKTHLSLAFFNYGICSNAECGVPYGATRILFAERNVIENWNKIVKSHQTPQNLKCTHPNDNDGNVHLSRMGKTIYHRSICQSTYQYKPGVGNSKPS